MQQNPLFKTHGMTVEKYNQLLKKQGGVCAVCKEPESFRKQRLSTDHCHKSHRFRGLLCNACNRGLGLFRDNPEALRAAADYLENNEWTL